MGLNTELIGKKYPTGTYEVTAEALRKYAAATNEDNPAFAGDSPVSSPAFLIVPAGTTIAQVMFDQELGANLMMLVHGEEDHLFLEPVKGGDTLAVESQIEAIEVKDSGETFSVLTTLTNQAGLRAAEVRSLMFIRGTGGRRGSSAETAEPERDVAFDTVQKIDDDQTYRYAEASGDHNPIHINEEFAKNAGLPGIIVHGMCTMAFASKAVLDAVCDGDPARLRRIKVRFSKPVLPGQTMSTRGWLEEKRDGLVVYGFEAVNPDGVPVIKNGIAEVVS